MIVAAPLANLVIRRLGRNADRQEVGGRLNNRAENSHQPFRLRERAMQRFRSMKTLQKFSSVHAEVHNHFNQERHLVTPSRERRSTLQGRATRPMWQSVSACTLGRGDRGGRRDRLYRCRHGGGLGASAAPAGPVLVLHRLDLAERLLGHLPVSHERTNRLAMSSIRIAPHRLKKPTRDESEETESRHE